MKKPAIAIAIGAELGVAPRAEWASNGDTIVAEWHEDIGQALQVPFAAYDSKPDHMRAMLASQGVAWDPTRHQSLITPPPIGGNLMVAAYADLLAALRRRP